MKQSKLSLGLIVSGIIVSTPNLAFGQSKVSAVVGGFTAGIGLFADAIELSSLAKWNDLEDNPLYSTAAVSPKLLVSVTETSFTFDLKQPLPIDFTVDDNPITLKGILGANPDGRGNRDIWEYDITFTYESSVDIGADTLTADGFIRHVYAPHPERGEVPLAPPLDVFVTLSEDTTGLPKWIRAKGKLDEVDHPNGPDKDKLTKVILQAYQSEDDQFDRWKIRISGIHACTPSGRPSPQNTSSTLRKNSQDTEVCSTCSPCKVPEPTSTLNLLALGTLGATFTLKRNKKQNKSTTKAA